MLTRNCVPNLFKRGDYNVRVTYFDRNPRFYQPAGYKKAWIEAIHDSIGEGVANSDFVYHVSVTTPMGSFSRKLSGREIAATISNRFSPTSVRIDITISNKQHTWIILVPTA